MPEQQIQRSEHEATSEQLPKLERERLVQHLELWLSRLQNAQTVEQNCVFSIPSKHQPSSSLSVLELTYSSPYLAYARWVLFAIKNNKLVGMQNTTLNNSGGGLIAEGNIEVFDRNQGVASALGQINSWLLQQKSLELPPHKNLTYQVEDANQTRIATTSQLLENARNQKNLSPGNSQVQELEELLNMQLKQRQAWEKLYGEGGTQGFVNFNNRLQKVFTPKTDITPPSVLEAAPTIDYLQLIQDKIDFLKNP